MSLFVYIQNIKRKIVHRMCTFMGCRLCQNCQFYDIYKYHLKFINVSVDIYKYRLTFIING